MRSLLFIALSLGIGKGALAQQDKLAMKYAAEITAGRAKQHLSILASDEFEGRETGKPGAEKAAQYIKAVIAKLGYKGPVNGGYFQKLDLWEKTVASMTLAVNGKELQAADFRAQFSGPKTTFTDFVFVGYGINSPKYNDLSGANIAGKVVIVLPGEPVLNGNYLITGNNTPSEWTTGRRPKKTTDLIASKPALIVNVTAAFPVSARASVPARPQLVMSKDQPAGTVNSVTLTADVVNGMMAATGKTIAGLQKTINETGKPAQVAFKSSLTVDARVNYTPLDAKDVLGFMEGSDPKLKKEILVYSAHYDHIGLTPPGSADKVNNGADDDGSGTTGILEIAAAWAKAKKEGHGPKRSILFLWNVGEEKGLLGAKWYTTHPLFPLANTIADLNIDMIGRVGYDYIGKPDSANYCYLIGSAMLSTTLRKISENANRTYMNNMILDYKYDDPNDPNSFYTRSDHYEFAKNGVPIIFYFNGTHDDYHQPSDEVSKINFPLLAKRAQLAFYTGWDLANRRERPAVDGGSIK